jgi:cardiolipin synthase
MGLSRLAELIAGVSAQLHPDHIQELCGVLSSTKDEDITQALRKAIGSSLADFEIMALLEALRGAQHVSAAEVSGMFRAASAVHLISRTQSVDLAWTGPRTGLVPVRETSQVLIGLIDEAFDRVFLVSFVAYGVGPIIEALQRAVLRKVRLRILLEKYSARGGRVTTDSASTLKRLVPAAMIYEWSQEVVEGEYPGSVHAKCAVADGKVAFITSANLTEAAMERNMELGVLLRGGASPRLLEQHLEALITARLVRAI